MQRCEALNSIGKIVEVFSGVNGNYIGQLEKVNTGICNIAVVKILACIRYPSQRTIMYFFNNYERWPFLYGSLETFPVNCLELFYGQTIPEYYELMPQVLDETFLIETEADRKIYERHKLHWKEKSSDFLLKRGG